MLEKVIQFQTEAGAPVASRRGAGYVVTVVPHAQAVTIRFPFGAFVWSRASSVEVDDGYTVQRIPIQDITRAVQVVSFGLSLLFLSTTFVHLISKRKAQNGDRKTGT